VLSVEPLEPFMQHCARLCSFIQCHRRWGCSCIP